MGSGHTLGEQNAAALGDLGTAGLTTGEGFFDNFVANKVYAARKTTTAAAVTASVTHGLAATPTYVLATCNTKAITWTANTTTITFIKASTGAAVIDVFAAVTA